MFCFTKSSVSNGTKAKWLSTYAEFQELGYWFFLLLALGYIASYNIWYLYVRGSYLYEYDSGNVPVARSGLAMHMVGGCAYLLSGFVQFSPLVRINYPSIHRVAGYVYLSMSGLMVIGILTIFIANGSLAIYASSMWMSLVVPYWVYVHTDGLIAIYRKDLARHRRMMFRGFAFGNSIIWTRLPFFTLLYIGQQTLITSLAIAFWFAAFIAIVFSEIYVATDKYFEPEPIVYLEDGRSFHATSTQTPGQGVSPIQIEIDQCELLEGGKSVKLVFRDSASPAMTFLFPGQHISLRLKGVWDSARELSPIVLDQYAAKGQIMVWVRLIPGGVISTALLNYCKQLSGGGNTGGGGGGDDVEGQGGILMNPMSSAAAVVDVPPAGSLPPSPFTLTVSSSRFTYYPGFYKHLVMVASGTGIAPLLTLVQQIVNNRSDTTKVTLHYLCREGDYGLSLLQPLIDAKCSRLVVVQVPVQSSSTSRFGISDLENAISKVSAAPRDASALQIHLSGSPTFVKAMHHGVLSSTVVSLSKPADQLVSWGYSDR